MLKVRLFGTGQAYFDDKPLDGFPNQQACLLLCYLLLNKPHPVHRERLANTFWGGYPTPEARKYLRNALWRLRQALLAVGAEPEVFIAVTEDSIAFKDACPHWLDIEEFERLIAGCLNLSEHEISPQQVLELEAAVDLYIGDLLESEYEDWCLYDREHLRLLYQNTVSKILAYCIIQRDFGRGLEYAGRLLALDDTQEKVHRQVMNLYWGQGDRRSAIEQYKRCYQILRQELGVPPTRETRKLYRRILDGESYESYLSKLSNNPVGTFADIEAGKFHAMFSQSSSKNSLIRRALEKLYELQGTLDETRDELRYIEHLIHKLLTESRG